MEYTQISQDYKYDLLAEQLYSREVEHFHYNFDKQNLENMLAAMSQEEPNRANIQQRLNDTITQMNIVEQIYNALQAQITDPAAYQAAVIRRANKV